VQFGRQFMVNQPGSFIVKSHNGKQPDCYEICNLTQIL